MWLYVSGISGFVGLSLSTAGSVTGQLPTLALPSFRVLHPNPSHALCGGAAVAVAKRTRDEFKIKGGVALHCLNQLNVCVVPCLGQAVQAPLMSISLFGGMMRAVLRTCSVSFG
jgi:hypothetical protein